MESYGQPAVADENENEDKIPVIRSSLIECWTKLLQAGKPKNPQVGAKSTINGIFEDVQVPAIPESDAYEKCSSSKVPLKALSEPVVPVTAEPRRATSLLPVPVKEQTSKCLIRKLSEDAISSTVKLSSGWRRLLKLYAFCGAHFGDDVIL